MNEAESVGPEMEHVSLPSMIRTTLVIAGCFSILYIILLILSSLVFWMLSIFVFVDLLFPLLSYKAGVRKRKPDRTVIEDIHEMDDIRKGFRYDILLLVVLGIALVIRPTIEVVAYLMLGGCILTLQCVENLGKVLVVRSHWRG